MAHTEQQRSSIPVAVLAAGASSRMGVHKLLLDLAGRPLVTWAVAAANASRAGEVLVILGRDAGALRAALASGRHTCVVNENAANGQATTLTLAIASLPATTPGLIVILADQPFMDVRSIDAVLAAAERRPDRIAMGFIESQSGHPVYLPRRLFPAIAALEGDTGARDIIATERAHITRVPLDSAFAQLDVDSPEDYSRATELAYLLATPGS